MPNSSAGGNHGEGQNGLEPATPFRDRLGDVIVWFLCGQWVAQKTTIATRL